jgi:hypothetical protein
LTTPESVAVVVCPNATPTASSAVGNIADRSLFKRLKKAPEALRSLKLFILYPPEKVSFGRRGGRDQKLWRSIGAAVTWPSAGSEQFVTETISKYIVALE